ncbi:phosphoribosylglycinamide formyltransferase [Saccharicrinis sp. FJH2]|uniref:phosphoribosylglycinamide formyltransferase n=1 Tax=Saccharicrinis sp. FJH65 TaxID=3344659 RepID=UPI0035F41A30
MKKLALLASGSGSNVENFYNYFKDNNNISISLVLCNNPSAFVIDRCKRLNIPCKVFNRDQFYKTEEIIDMLNSYSIDFIVLAGFLWLIPKYLIRAFDKKMVNIHPALLPKYGGKGMYGDNVHKAVVENREIKSGITIHYVNEHFDEGEIIFQAECPVQPTDTYAEVASKVHELEYAWFPKVVEELLNDSPES